MAGEHSGIGGIFKDVVCGKVDGGGFARSWLQSTTGNAGQSVTQLGKLLNPAGLSSAYYNRPLIPSHFGGPPKVTDPISSIPSFLAGAIPCPPTESGVKAAFDRALRVDEYWYHNGNHLYKQEHNAHHWGSECAYDRTTGQLIPSGKPGAGTADFWPDGTLGHLFLDPGGPRLIPSTYDQYWRSNPHPPGMVRRN